MLCFSYCTETICFGFSLESAYLSASALFEREYLKSHLPILPGVSSHFGLESLSQQSSYFQKIGFIFLVWIVVQELLYFRLKLFNFNSKKIFRCNLVNAKGLGRRSRLSLDWVPELEFRIVLDHRGRKKLRDILSTLELSSQLSRAQFDFIFLILDDQNIVRKRRD